jgi:hypothetical protein
MGPLSTVLPYFPSQSLLACENDLRRSTDNTDLLLPCSSFSFSWFSCSRSANRREKPSEIHCPRSIHRRGRLQKRRSQTLPSPLVFCTTCPAPSVLFLVWTVKFAYTDSFVRFFHTRPAGCVTCGANTSNMGLSIFIGGRTPIG